MKLSTRTLGLIGSAFLAIGTLATPALADDPITRSDEAQQAAFEADRSIILSMAGDYKVTFNMQESAA